jgi:hypothetical protein
MCIFFYFVNLAAASPWLRRSWSPNYSVLVLILLARHHSLLSIAGGAALGKLFMGTWSLPIWNPPSIAAACSRCMPTECPTVDSLFACKSVTSDGDAPNKYPGLPAGDDVLYPGRPDPVAAYGGGTGCCMMVVEVRLAFLVCFHLPPVCVPCFVPLLS